MKDNGVIIRSMRSSDAPQISRLHASSIPQGFLSSLPNEVRSTLYRGISRAPESGVWVAENQNDHVLGFIAGTANVGHCYLHTLSRNAPSLVYHALPVIVDATQWRRVWETLTYPLRPPDHEERPDQESRSASAELLSIAVDASAQGRGIATSLTMTFEDALKGWGHTGSYRVVTSASDPVSNSFYLKTGFTRAGTYSHHGIRMACYLKDLDSYATRN